VNRVLADIAVTSMLDACLVAAQALVLNSLGIPFAAITAFSGIGAYAVALALGGSWIGLAFAALLTAVTLAGFSFLAPLLPQDRYLLLTLAVLGVLLATAGSAAGLGGQLGLKSASTLLPPQEPLPFAVAAVLLFSMSLLAHALIGRSEFGLAVSVARNSRLDITAKSFIPVKRITLVCFVIAASIAMLAGVLRATYSGRVDPNQLRIRTAIVILMPTLAAGSSPLRIGILSVVFFAFPDCFAVLFGYDATSLAYIREMAWSALIIAMVPGNVIARLRTRIKVQMAAQTRY